MAMLLRSRLAPFQCALLGSLSALAALSSLLQPASSTAQGPPERLEFYMRIAVQNNSRLLQPGFTAVQSAQPLVPQPNSFGIIHTFDNPLTSGLDLNSAHLGRVQGWYGDVGQETLTLFLVQTFTWDDGRYKGTFSLVGLDVATESQKLAAIVGGTGDFAYARGVAQQSLVSTTTIDSRIVSWFHYTVDFKY